ncbi:MAG: DUF169 domain-containing protein [Gammaproteobacteria bacterium]
MSYENTARSLDRLGVRHPAVALAIVEAPPAGLPVETRTAISSCAFWRRAESEVFYATAQAHQGCAVGAYVMGLPRSAGAQAELADTVALMCGQGYLREDEIPSIPRVARAGGGVVYGPLERFPGTADCALAWVEPAQAMVLGEALGTTAWTGHAPGGTRLTGRPACAALARATNDAQESLSLGCAGMRTFTGIAPALALFVIPAHALATLAGKLDRMLVSNEAMLAHYRERRGNAR